MKEKKFWTEWWNFKWNSAIIQDWGCGGQGCYFQPNPRVISQISASHKCTDPVFMTYMCIFDSLISVQNIRFCVKTPCKYYYFMNCIFKNRKVWIWKLSFLFVVWNILLPIERRPYGLHMMIALQLYLFGSYCFTWPEMQIRYLYMLKTFEGFDGADFSIFFAFTCCGCLDKIWQGLLIQ